MSVFTLQCSFVLTEEFIIRELASNASDLVQKNLLAHTSYNENSDEVSNKNFWAKFIKIMEEEIKDWSITSGNKIEFDIDNDPRGFLVDILEVVYNQM